MEERFIFSKLLFAKGQKEIQFSSWNLNAHLSMMHVLLVVHVDNNDQQSAVACGIALSHEDLHEVSSVSSCADPNSQSVVPSTSSQRNGSLLGIPINSQGSC